MGISPLETTFENSRSCYSLVAVPECLTDCFSSIFGFFSWAEDGLQAGSEFCLSTTLFVSSPPRSKLDRCLFTLGRAGLDESEAWPEKLNTSETFPPGGVFLL